MKISLLFLATILFLQTTGQTVVSKSSVKVSGEVTRPLTLSLDDLAKMKRTSVDLTDRGGMIIKYSGVSLQEILSMAGVTMGSQLRGENLSKFLLVKCADGYEVVLSLAEIDSSFTDRKVILADAAEGKPLPAGKGPFRLVVPGEKKPARSCFQVTDFIVKFSKD